MSTVQKLSIRGIRSFPPDQENIIDFEGKPLTVISGMNGCGKTTIIECLKYATTGSLPPNSSNGQSFVFDPKMTNHDKVQSQVKASIKHRTRGKLFVSRNLQVTQKKTKLEFKQLEVALKVKRRGGQEESSSGKCLEVDRVLPEFMGVSKAILENVIFCHQEESTWPLMESSVLKKKFDDIFESTRYNKALDEIKKQKKRLAEQVKEYEKTKDVLEVHRRQANKIASELSEAREAEEDVEKQLKELGGKIDNVNQEIDELEGTLNSLKKETNEYQSVRIEISQLKQTTNALAKELLKLHSKEMVDAITKLDPGETFQDKINSIEKEQRNAQTLLQEQEAKVDSAESKVRELKLQVNDKTAEIQDQEKKKISLEAQREQQVALEQRLISYLLKFHRTSPFKNTDVLAKLEALQGSSSSSDASSERMSVIRLAFKSIQDAHKKAQEKVDEKSRALETAREERRAEMSKFETEKTIAQAEQEKVQSQVSTLSEEITALTSRIHLLQGPEIRQGQLEHVEEELQKFTAELEHLQQSQAANGYEAMMKENQDESSQTQKRIQDLRNEVRELEGKQEQVHQFRSHLQQLAKLHTDHAISSEQTAESLRGIQALHNMNLELQEAVDQVEATGNEMASGTLQSSTECALKQLQLLMSTVDPQTQKFQDKTKKLFERKQTDVRDLENKQVEIDLREKHTAQAIADLELEVKDLDGKELDIPEVARMMQEKGYFDVDEIRQVLQENVHDAADNLAIASYTHKSVNAMIYRIKKGMDKENAPDKKRKTCCPTCQRDMEEEFPLNASRGSTLKTITRPFQKWFDSNYTLLQDLKYVATVGSKGDKSVTVEFKKGSQLRGAEYLLAHLCASVLNAKSDEKDSLEKELENARKTLDALNRLAPSLQRREQAKEELEKLKQDLDEVENERRSNSSQLNKVRDECVDLEALVKTLESAMEDVRKLRSSCEEVKRMSEEAAALGKRLGMSQKDIDMTGFSSSSSMSFAQANPLEATRSTLRAEEQKASELQKKREEMMEVNAATQRKLQTVQTKVSELRQERLDAQEKTNEYKDLQRKLQEKEAELQSYSEAAVDAKKQLATASRKLKEMMDRVSRERRREDTELAEATKTSQDVWENVSVCASMLDQVDSFSKAGLDNAILKIDNQIGVLEGERHHLQRELKAKQKVWDAAVNAQREVSEGMSSSGRFLDLAKKMQHMGDLQKRRDDLKTKLEQSNAATAEDSIREARKRLSKLETAKAKLEGKLGELQNRQDALERDLRQENYRQIEFRHKDAAIKWHTTKTAVQDLDRYYSALDSALMQFHQEKIEEINQRIAQLWSVMYRGGDIDRIELRSEKTTSGRSRSFNYRVVMTKSDTQLDMRGRCSAGQKILASLVIRMALAESFSVNCGILALDEPTTNLDLNNKEGLANSLSEILKQMKETRFQLIVITHDQEFVDSLAKHVEAVGQEANYYKVERFLNANRQYVSRVVDMN